MSIADAVTSPGAVAVAVNPAPLRAMEVDPAGAARSPRHPMRRNGYGTPALSSSTPAPRRCRPGSCVLTAPLARKFYIAGDIRVWRKVFQLGQGPAALPRLLAETYRDGSGRRYANQARDPFPAMLLAEETAVEALRDSYTSSAATAWKAAEKIGEA